MAYFIFGEVGIGCALNVWPFAPTWNLWREISCFKAVTKFVCAASTVKWFIDSGSTEAFVTRV